MFDYFISYVRVPHDETTDVRRWGNSTISIAYPLDTTAGVMAIEKDIAEQLEVKSICLMHWQPIVPPTGNEHLDYSGIEGTLPWIAKDLEEMQYFAGGQIVQDLKNLIGEVKKLRSQLYSG